MRNVEQLKKQLRSDVSKAIDAIANWSEFDFKLNGVSCHYEHYHGIQVVDMSDLGGKLMSSGNFWTTFVNFKKK
jgi:hypothetical protein